MILAMIGLSYLSHAEYTPVRKPLAEFPTRIDDWSGELQRFDQKIYDILGVDDSFLATYLDPTGRQVQLYVGYYQSQREGDLIHSPKHCMPGGGWEIVRTSLEELTVPHSNPGKIKVIKLILQKETEQQVVLYWFQSRGRFISSEYLQKIYLVWDAISKRRTDGAFVRLISPVQKSEAATTRMLKTFAKRLIPILEEYLPGS